MVGILALLTGCGVAVSDFLSLLAKDLEKIRTLRLCGYARWVPALMVCNSIRTEKLKAEVMS